MSKIKKKKSSNYHKPNCASVAKKSVQISRTCLPVGKVCEQKIEKNRKQNNISPQKKLPSNKYHKK
jgi:hypothetical protein